MMPSAADKLNLMALVLVVEDEPEIAEILDAYLGRDGFRTVRAADGLTGLQHHRMLRPDLVVLDVKLPKADGFEVLAEIRRRGDTPVIMATALAEDLDKLSALRIGADDYVVKPFSPREVTARVTAILRRARPAPAPTPAGQAAHGRLSLDVEAWQAAWDGAPLALTVTEFGILRTLAAAPNRVFSRDAIIDHLRGPGFAVTDRTVDSHVRNLRAKFAGVGAHDVIETRAGIGYRLGPCLGGTP